MKTLHLVPVLAAALAAALSAGGARAGASDWAKGFESRIRLISADGPANAAGEREAGIDLALEAGWKTYWRQPGDAGVPPSFDFSASRNLASARVLYPAPKRFVEGGVVSAGYSGSLVFPVLVAAKDPSAPVELVLKADYGICRETCVPASGEVALTIPADAPRDIAAAVPIGVAIRKVPEAAQASGLRVESVTVAADGLDIAVRLDDAGADGDLFAEGPADWYLPLPELQGHDGDLARFRLELSSRPAGAPIAGAAFVFTATNGARAIEQNWRLD